MCCRGKTPLGMLSENGEQSKNISRKKSREKVVKVVKVAGVTRLELATSGVTGRRSNQTELHPRGWDKRSASKFQRTGVHRIYHRRAVNMYRCYFPWPGKWWAVTGSNRRPFGCKPNALPAELTALYPKKNTGGTIVTPPVPESEWKIS